MSANKHTPGPWFTDFEALGVCVVGNHSRQVCECYEDGETQVEEDAANARLIAAAPDLLEALEEFEIQECSSCGGNGHDHGTDEHNACHYCGGNGEVVRGGWPTHVREAIAKAKGKP